MDEEAPAWEVFETAPSGDTEEATYQIHVGEIKLLISET